MVCGVSFLECKIRVSVRCDAVSFRAKMVVVRVLYSSRVFSVCLVDNIRGVVLPAYSGCVVKQE